MNSYAVTNSRALRRVLLRAVAAARARCLRRRRRRPSRIPRHERRRPVRPTPARRRQRPTCRRSASTSGTTSRRTTAAAVPRRRRPDAAVRAQRRREPRLRGGEQRRQLSRSPIESTHGHQGRRRPQLLARESTAACGDILTVVDPNWAGASAAGGAQRQLLSRRRSRTPGASKNFPAMRTLGALRDAPSIRSLEQYCSRCHSLRRRDHAAVAVLRRGATSTSRLRRRRSRRSISTIPRMSRLVVRLRNEFHNCWTRVARPTRNTMQAAIQDFANGIDAHAGRSELADLRRR